MTASRAPSRGQEALSEPPILTAERVLHTSAKVNKS